MISLVLYAVLIMFGCFALGSLIAWLLAVALYPTQAESLPQDGASGATRERVRR